MWSRIYLIPLLSAEEDRDQVRRYLAQQKMEEELLGKSSKVYNSDRYVCESTETSWIKLTFCRFVRPTFAVTPSFVTK